MEYPLCAFFSQFTQILIAVAVAVAVTVVVGCVLAAASVPVLLACTVAVSVGAAAGFATFELLNNDKGSAPPSPSATPSPPLVSVPEVEVPVVLPEPIIIVPIEFLESEEQTPFSCDILVEEKTTKIRCDNSKDFEENVRSYLKTLPKERREYKLTIDTGFGDTTRENFRDWKIEELGPLIDESGE